MTEVKIQETLREDGLHIITCRVPSKKNYVEITARVGSAYDPPGKQGLSHYFEHMAFKGTRTRNTEAIRAFSRRNLLKSNASTGRLETSYYGECIHKKMPLLCEFLADIYFNSVFPQDEIEREKEVVLNEMALRQDDDEYVAHQTLCQCLWKQNPIRTSPLGTSEDVKSVTRKDLLKARGLWYVPANTIIIATGRVDHDDFAAQIEKHIPCGKKQNVAHKDWDDEYGEVPEQKEVILERPQREKATIIFGCKFPLRNDYKTAVLVDLFRGILTHGDASLLWTELREKRGLAYSLNGGISGVYPLGYYFYVLVETLPRRVETVRELIREIIFRPITDESRFENTKEYLNDQYAIGYDQNINWAHLIRWQLREGYRPKSVERHFSKLGRIMRKTTLDEVEDLHRKTLVSEKFVTIVIKPT